MKQHLSLSQAHTPGLCRASRNSFSSGSEDVDCIFSMMCIEAFARLWE